MQVHRERVHVGVGVRDERVLRLVDAAPERVGNDEPLAPLLRVEVVRLLLRMVGIAEQVRMHEREVGDVHRVFG